ncbi:apolipoprotein L3-like [Lissotriton helveticus]
MNRHTRRAELRGHTESLFTNLKQVLQEEEKLRETAETLQRIAADLDIFHRNATKVNFLGSLWGVSGGALALGGLVLAPFTGGASLVVAGAGLGVSTLGGVTSAGASVVNAINSKMDKDKVEALMKECQTRLEKIKQNIEVASHLAEEIRELEVSANPDFGNMFIGVGQAGLHLSKLVKTLQVLESGRLLARVAGSATVVFSAFFVVFDLLSLIHSGKELSRGAPSELAGAIRKAEGGLRATITELQVPEIERMVRELRASLSQ